MGYRAGVVGAAGFAGIELVRLLSRHPEFDLAAATSDALAGTPIAKAYPAFTGVTDLAFSTHENTDFSAFDVVFLAVPHKAAMGMAPDLMAAGVTVVDLSADFRLKDSRCHLVGQTMRRFDVMHKVLLLKSPCGFLRWRAVSPDEPWFSRVSLGFPRPTHGPFGFSALRSTMAVMLHCAPCSWSHARSNTPTASFRLTYRRFCP